MTDSKVVQLDAHIPQEVRQAAARAYKARLRHQSALAEVAYANRAFSQACKRFKLHPSKIQVGELDGRSLVPAGEWGPLR